MVAVRSQNTEDLTPSVENIEISIRDHLSHDEVLQLEALYLVNHIADPCSHCACFGGTQFTRDRKWIAENASLPGTTFALAHKQDELIGFAQFHVDPDCFPAFVGDIATRFVEYGKSSYMYLILVDSKIRSQGVGQKLYQAAFEEALRAGCTTMLAEIFVCPVPNSTSLRFHESLGFQYSGKTVTHLRVSNDKKCDLTYTQLFKPLTRVL